jgi:hypothetical protein
MASIFFIGSASPNASGDRAGKADQAAVCRLRASPTDREDRRIIRLVVQCSMIVSHCRVNR